MVALTTLLVPSGMADQFPETPLEPPLPLQNANYVAAVLNGRVLCSTQ